MDNVELEREIREEFPKFKVVPKSESTLMKVADICLKLITFWQLRTFMTRFTTTVGYTVYVTDSWASMSPVSKMVLLRHERVHMRQRRKYGSFLFTVLYLFLFFPVGIAYFRAKFEKEAYAEGMRAMLELLPETGVSTLQSKQFRDRTVRHFTTAEYFWMWPWKRSIERWYDETVRRLTGP